MPVLLFRILFILGAEALMAGFALIVSHGRLEDQLAWFSGLQLMIVAPVVAIILTVRYRIKHHTGPGFTKVGKIVTVAVAIALVLAVAGWTSVVFPALVDASLKRYGKSEQATIISYRLLNYGPKNVEFTSHDVATADALTVTIRYQGHTSKLLIDKSDKDFNQIYQLTQNTTLPVRYLPWLPALARPQAELD